MIDLKIKRRALKVLTVAAIALLPLLAVYHAALSYKDVATSYETIAELARPERFAKVIEQTLFKA